VFSSAVQVVWEKFANYWDVEPRYVPMTSEAPCLTGEGVLKVVDENTIAVVAILGVTYTGNFEPVKEIAAALDTYQAETGIDIPIHVDAASGGFIAPFVDPDLEWDFRVERVHSINTSGHKFGLVYPGLGWVVWAKREYLPDDLIFNVSYLGGDMPTFGLNFSRPGAQVLLQYYNFLRLGRDGYTRVQKTALGIGRHMAKEIAGMAAFDIYSDGTDMPMITWTLKEGHTDKWDLYDLADRMRERGWSLPAYPMPADMEDVTVMRVGFRNGVSTDLVSLLLGDIRGSVEYLDALASPLPKKGKKSSYTH
jgi:glutamate decarboxylase